VSIGDLLAEFEMIKRWFVVAACMLALTFMPAAGRSTRTPTDTLRHADRHADGGGHADRHAGPADTPTDTATPADTATDTPVPADTPTDTPAAPTDTPTAADTPTDAPRRQIPDGHPGSARRHADRYASAAHSDGHSGSGGGHADRYASGGRYSDGHPGSACRHAHGPPVGAPTDPRHPSRHADRHAGAGGHTTDTPVVAPTSTQTDTPVVVPTNTDTPVPTNTPAQTATSTATAPPTNTLPPTVTYTPTILPLKGSSVTIRGLVQAQCAGPASCNSLRITFAKGTARIELVRPPHAVGDRQVGKIKMTRVFRPQPFLNARVVGDITYGADPDGDCPLANTQVVGAVYATGTMACETKRAAANCKGILALPAFVPGACTDGGVIVTNAHVEVYDINAPGSLSSLIARDGLKIAGHAEVLHKAK
jgi:hypothetical protein